MTKQCPKTVADHLPIPCTLGASLTYTMPNTTRHSASLQILTTISLTAAALASSPLLLNTLPML